MKITKRVVILLILTTTVAIAYLFINIEQKIIVSNAPDFKKITDTKQRKNKFFEYLAPIISKQNQKILQLRNKIKNQQLSNDFLIKTASKYRTNVNNLLNVIDIIPVSLALAQAANESNWGRSRFAKYNNYYGLWCFKKGCGVVPKSRDNNAKHEVATFSTIQAATRYYMWNLNSHSAYKELRNIRFLLRQAGKKVDGISLANGLKRYSGIGDEYIKTLKEMINHNNLLNYD